MNDKVVQLLSSSQLRQKQQQDELNAVQSESAEAITNSIGAAILELPVWRSRFQEMVDNLTSIKTGGDLLELRHLLVLNQRRIDCWLDKHSLTQSDALFRHHVQLKTLIGSIDAYRAAILTTPDSH